MGPLSVRHVQLQRLHEQIRIALKSWSPQASAALAEQRRAAGCIRAPPLLPLLLSCQSENSAIGWSCDRECVVGTMPSYGCDMLFCNPQSTCTLSVKQTCLLAVFAHLNN